MEDEVRPLPEGWVRQWDSKEQHQFFVDTKTDPPRSIWVHPIDDEDTWNSLSSEEKERLQAAESKMKRSPSFSKDEKSTGQAIPQEHYPTDLPPRSSGSTSQPHVSQGSQKKGLGERLKDKVTGTTHDEREQSRARRDEEERQYYEMHARFRAAMQRAAMTGQPQWFAKDRDGKDIFVEPPAGPGYGYRGYGGGYGYNPYTSGPYSTPNARYIRPGYGYGRPGYGGGMALPLAGGLFGGAMLGGLLF